jgi:hypothetical protein
MSPEGSHRINGFTSHALSAFMLTASIWESLLNWAFCSVWTRIYFGDAVAKRVVSLGDDLDRLSLLKRTYVLPLIAFEKSFDKSSSPFQDLQVLVGIRNQIVHEVQGRAPEKEIEVLRSRGCLLHDGERPRYPSDEQSWQNDISTLESIRWCLNILPPLVEELINFSENDGARKHLRKFGQLSVSEAKKFIGAQIQAVPFPFRR